MRRRPTGPDGARGRRRRSHGSSRASADRAVNACPNPWPCAPLRQDPARGAAALRAAARLAAPRPLAPGRARDLHPARPRARLGRRRARRAARASPPRPASRDYAACSRAEAEAEWQAADAAGARPLLLGAADYPPLLATIADPPPLLWALGDPALAARPTVALVGARNASALGCRMAVAARRRPRRRRASSSPPASPAASTPPPTAPRSPPAPSPRRRAGSTSSTRPRTPPSPPRSPPTGLRLSEMPMGHAPRAQDFPRRNRIVSGLALGVVVVEGAAALGQPDHRPQRPRPGPRGDGGARQPARRPRRRLQRADPRRRHPRPRRRRRRRGARRGPDPRAAAVRPRSVAPSRPTAADGSLEGRLLGLLGPAPVAEDVLIRALAAAGRRRRRRARRPRARRPGPPPPRRPRQPPRLSAPPSSCPKYSRRRLPDPPPAQRRTRAALG